MFNRIMFKGGHLLVDLAVLSAAYLLAFAIRFEGDIPHLMVKRMFFTWPYVVLFQYIVMVVTGVTQIAWRYISTKDIPRIFLALFLSTSSLVVIRFLAETYSGYSGYAVYVLIPLGILGIDFMMVLLGIPGVRLARRMIAEYYQRHRQTPEKRVEATPTLLYGAGQVGAMMAKEAENRPNLGVNVVGFLDDDPVKHGLVISGSKVLGGLEDLEALCRKLQVGQVVITIAQVKGQTVRRISQACENAGVSVKIVPGLYEIMDGSVSLSRFRDVSIADLLNREVITLETDLIGEFLTGKRVMITGAGGSIGSEICRQVMRFKPESLLLVEQHENSLFTIHQELRAIHGDDVLEPLICDVCDTERVEEIFQKHAPHVVFHAAAHKHVPMMEWNPLEAVKNNIFGTQTVALAADRHQAQAFVLISTDKAVNPTSIMGSSKRMAEIVIQSLSSRSETKYVAVRFGNVLGSAGSVVPIFKQQIADGGPVTVTHAEMTRYFMTIPEATQLVMQAGAMGQGGEIFVLDMGEPVKIMDLAKDLIRLSGFKLGEDIAINVTGVRPGEKLFEELSFNAEKMDITRHPKIYIGKLSPKPWDEIKPHLQRLGSLKQVSSNAELRGILKEAIPEMQVPADTQDSQTATKPDAA